MLRCARGRGYIGIGLYLEDPYQQMLSYRGEVQLTANVAEFPILEDKEVFPLSDFLEAFDCSIGEVIDDVGMCLEDADGIADFFGQAKESGGVVDVGGETEVGLLDGDKGKEIAG